MKKGTKNQQFMKLVRPVAPLRHQAPLPRYITRDVAEFKLLLNRAGYDASDADIQWAWEEYSAERAAGWIGAEISDIQYIIQTFLKHLVYEL